VPKLWSTGGIWIGIGGWNFWGNFWRRGTHVNTPEIGSRDGGKCLGEFWGFHAVLRREFWGGEFGFGLFEDLGGEPRRPAEEGGHLCVLLCIWGNLWGYSLVYCRWASYLVSRITTKGELFGLKNNHKGRAIWSQE
jgi:hypothetical protein